MKRLLVSVLIVLLAVSALYAGGRRETATTPLVAVSLPGSVEFFSVQKIGLDKAAEDYGLRLVYADAEWDAGRQLNQVEDFIARGVDMVLLCAADNQALLPAVDAARAAGVPLITFTNVLGNDPQGKLDGVVSFVGINDITQGRQLGEMAVRLLGDGPANIVLIEGAPGTSPQRMRTQGFEQIVSQYPQWNIVYRQAIPGWTKEGALAALEAFVQTGNQADLVATHWHAAAAAAATAIEESGVEQTWGRDVHVISIEYTRELRPLISSGKVAATNYASIVDMGYRAVEAAAKHLRGETLPAFIEIDPIIVDGSNVAEVEPEM